MAIAQLRFQKENYISTVAIDAVIQESASASVKLTENPVENGANMNDHIIVQPMSFAVNGVVSNISSSVVGQFERIPTIFTPNSTRAREAWDALLELQVTREPFTLVQGLKQYENVVILTLTEAQDKDTANALFFSATMQQVIMPGTQTVTADQFNDTNIADKAVPAVVGGLKQLGA